MRYEEVKNVWKQAEVGDEPRKTVFEIGKMAVDGEEESARRVLHEICGITSEGEPDGSGTETRWKKEWGSKFQEARGWASIFLAEIYSDGIGVEQNDGLAAVCWRLAASYGHALGMVNYADCLEKGRGVEQDMEAAVQSYQHAAGVGVATAVGVLIHWGEYIEGPETENRAQMMYDTARAGREESQYVWGMWTLLGAGVPEDREKAEDWIRTAAGQEQRDAMYELAVRWEEGEAATELLTKAADAGLDRAEEKLTSRDEDRERRARQARGALERQAMNEDLEAAYLLGACLDKSSRSRNLLEEEAWLAGRWRGSREEGTIGSDTWWEDIVTETAHDPAEARRWTLKAANGGHRDAQRRMGAYASGGRYGRRDVHVAKKWFEKAAGQGDIRARVNLGMLSRRDSEKQRFTQEAVTHYEAALKLKPREDRPWDREGQDTAMLELARVAEESGDDRRAFEWVRKAAESGSTAGRVRVAWKKLHGEGTDADPPEALHMLERLAQEGDADAQGMLGIQYVHGDFVKVDRERGMALLEKSARGGSAYGKKNLKSRRQIDAMFDNETGMAWFRSTGEKIGGRDVVIPMEPPSERC